MSWTAKHPAFKKLLPRKLSWKLTLIYSVLFSAILVTLNAGTLLGIRYYMREETKAQVRSSSARTLGRIVSPNQTVRLSDPAYLSEAETVPEISVLIADASGKTVSSSAKAVPGLPLPFSNPGAATAIELHDDHFITENSRIMNGGTLIGYLQVTYNMRSEYRFLRLLFAFTAAADFLGIACSVLVGNLLSRRALKPIDSLTKAAKQIGGTDLSQRVEVGPADDELSRLALTFNEMIGRLQEAFERQNRFVADASHELRTPIAVIRGYADLIAQWAKDDPEVLEESVAAIRKEARDMTGLIEELLFLARADSGRLQLQAEDFSAADLIGEITEESRLIAPEHHFEWEAPEDLRLFADRKLLKQALRALVDNAVKYTPKNGSVKITAFRTEERIVLQVRDSGIGIPEDEQSKLFDRFYRVDKGRSKESGGSGLGLSIVRQIVEAHRGTVTIESRKGEGTCVTIRLPPA